MTTTTSLGEWALNYLNFAQTKFSRKTYLEKSACFRRFFSAIAKEKDVNDLGPGDVLKHLTKQATKRSGYAANKDRKNLMVAWKWGVKYQELPPINPCQVERFPEERSPRHVPSESDYWKVYEQAWTEQDATMLFAYLHLAARKSELFRLSWDDVDFEDEKVRLYTKKTKDGSLEESWLPMSDDLKDSLATHRNKEVDEKWVFTDPESGYPYTQRRHWLKNLCKRAQVRH
ncbi:integrase, partial [bacterium]|nr:integrase [bacterium]